jgi:Protein of unknown function (DUF2721)
MEIDLTTPALLFSTISLLLLAFTNRFLGLAKTIRELHSDYQTNPQKRFLDQIKNLRQRVLLIRNMQMLGAGSLLLCTLSMLFVFAGRQPLAMFTFTVSLILMVLALTLSMIEIGMSVGALNVHLSDMEQALAFDEQPVKGWSRIFRPLGQFSITSMLWMSLVAALAILWIRDHSELTRLTKGPTVGNPSWSVEQILGPPNTPGIGDYPTAWASKTQDNQREWVIVEFARSVPVDQMAIYETLNPGAIVKVSTVSATGAEQVVWDGILPTVSLGSSAPGSAQQMNIKFKQPVDSRRFKIEIDSPSVRGWNEIDAVSISDAAGNIQWASDAWASSSFGANQEAPSWYWP